MSNTRSWCWTNRRRRSTSSHRFARIISNPSPFSVRGEAPAGASTRTLNEETTMDLQLKNQTAAIIGAARGIGHAIAREFAREGANVVLVDREKSVTDAATALAKECGVQAHASIADVTDYAAMQKVASQFANVDHLVF